MLDVVGRDPKLQVWIRRSDRRLDDLGLTLVPYEGYQNYERELRAAFREDGGRVLPGVENDRSYVEYFLRADMLWKVHVMPGESIRFADEARFLESFRAEIVTEQDGFGKPMWRFMLRRSQTGEMLVSIKLNGRLFSWAFAVYGSGLVDLDTQIVYICLG